MTDGSIIMNYDVSELSNKPEKKKKEKLIEAVMKETCITKKTYGKGKMMKIAISEIKALSS